MPQRLSDIKPEEISLVHRGANRRPFLLMKSDGELEVDPGIVEILEKAADNETELVAALTEAGVDEPVLKAALAAHRLAADLPAEVLKALPAFLRDDDEDDDPEKKPVAKGVEPPADIPPADVNRGGADMPEGDAPKVPIRKDDGSWDLSGVPEDSRPDWEAILEKAERVEKAEAERNTLAERIEKVEAQANELRDDALDREYLAKAEGLDKLPLAPDEFAPVLKDIAGKVEPDTFEKLETVLRAANESIGQGALFAEIGGAGSVAKSDAESRIDAKAEEIRKADPELTKEQAFVKALEDNPELYAQYRREVG